MRALSITACAVGLSIFLSGNAMAEFLDSEAVSEKIANGAVVLDVRTPAEFAEGSLVSAANIPVGELETKLSEVGSDKNREVIVYCQRGARAGKAKEVLERNGFTRVYNAGGFPELRDAGLKTK
ncbi:MAG: rhodanese-like domain-containing protein [Deltaproteobacteria bacterium]|nr:rhodanese-like domain-containing protein [Deltaproteobacteria bacterium]